ncbi:MAG: hypothetical protein WDA20_04385 [Desulfuromonadales bacterium]
MKRLICLTLLFSLLTLQAEADTLGLSLNDDSVQLDYRHLLVEDDFGRSVAHGRFLYNDDEDTRLGSVGFDFVGEPGNLPGLEVGIGVQVYGGVTDASQDILALGIGGRSEYFPPTLGGFGAMAKIIYAPRILSFLDTERMLEAGFGVAYSMTPRVRLTLEYQEVRAKFDDHGTWLIDDGVRAGFQARF